MGGIYRYRMFTCIHIHGTEWAAYIAVGGSHVYIDMDVRRMGSHVSHIFKQLLRCGWSPSVLNLATRRVGPHAACLLCLVHLHIAVTVGTYPNLLTLAVG